MSTKSIEARLQKAREDEAKAAQKVRALQAAVAGVERKRDAKRKIILGAWLMEHHPDACLKAVAALTRESDKAAFEGWSPKRTKKPAEPPEAAPKGVAPAAAPRPAQAGYTPPPGGSPVLRRPA